MTARASEQGHWYATNGTPTYEVPYKDPAKGMRKTTLRDARNLGLVPGVTTIIRAAAAPALERWKRNQVLLASLTLTREPNEPDDAFVARINEDADQHAKDAAARGTAIHADIERLFQGEEPLEHQTHAYEVRNLIHATFPGRQWQTEEAFAHPAGFGSKVDLWSPGSDGLPDLILDFKTKDYTNDDLIAGKCAVTYEAQWMQLAAGAMGVASDNATAQGFIVYTNRGAEPMPVIVKVDRKNMERGHKMFMALLDYWCHAHDFDPSFSGELPY